MILPYRMDHDHGKSPFKHCDMGKAHHHDTHHSNVRVLSKPVRSEHITSNSSQIQLNNESLTCQQRCDKKSQNTSRPNTHSFRSEFSASTPTLNKIDRNDIRPSVLFSNPQSHIDVNYPTSLMKCSLEDIIHVREHVPIPVQIPTIPAASLQVVKSSELENISSHSNKVRNSAPDAFPLQSQYGITNYHSISAVPVNLKLNTSPQPMTKKKFSTQLSLNENSSRKWSNTGIQSLESRSQSISSMRGFTVNLPSRKRSSVSSEENVDIDELSYNGEEIDSPFVSAAFDDAISTPSNCATEPVQFTKLKSYPKLLSTFISNSPTLPCKVRIIKGTLYPSNAVAISSGHDLEIHFIKHSKAFSVQDASGNFFVIPFNSSIKVSVIYNPSNPVKFVQYRKEFKFRSAGDIMKLKTIPLVVAATKAYTGETIKSSVNKRQILVIKGIKTSSTKGYQLMAKTLSGAKKLLSAECIGNFSTAPTLICMSLKEFLKCKITLPQQVFLDYPASSQKIKNLPSVITIMERTNGSSIIATCPSLANESKVLEIPFSSSLVVQEIENAKTNYTTDCLYESFDACTVAHCSESPQRVCHHDIQNTFYKCLSSTHRSLGWEISNPEALNTKQHPVKFENTDLTQKQADTPICVKSSSEDNTKRCNPSVLNSYHSCDFVHESDTRHITANIGSSVTALHAEPMEQTFSGDSTKATIMEVRKVMSCKKKNVPPSPINETYTKMEDNEDKWANNTVMGIPEINNHDDDITMNVVVSNVEKVSSESNESRSTPVTLKKSEHSRNQEGSLNVSNSKSATGYFGTRLSKAKTRIGQFLHTSSRIVSRNSPMPKLITATSEFNPEHEAEVPPKQTLAASTAVQKDSEKTSPVPSMALPLKAQKTINVSKQDVINNSPENYSRCSMQRDLKDVVDSNDHHVLGTISTVTPATTAKVPTRDQHQKPPLAPKPENYIKKTKQATPNLVLGSKLQHKDSKPANQDLAKVPTRDQHQKPPLAPKPENYIKKTKQATPNLVLGSKLQHKDSKPANQDLVNSSTKLSMPSTHKDKNTSINWNESSGETEDLDAIVDSIANWCLQIEDEVNQLSHGLQ